MKAVTGPIYEEVKIDAAPIDLARVLHHREGFAFLDSSQVSPEYGRYSLMAWEPSLVFEIHREGCRLLRKRKWTSLPGPHFSVLRELLESRKLRLPDDPPVPFAGGAIGFLSYELKDLIEEIPSRARDDMELPLARLAFFDDMMVYDHIKTSWVLIRVGDLRSPTHVRRLEEELKRALERGGQGEEPPRVIGATLATGATFAQWNLSRRQYMECVEKALEHILDGNVYQVNLSRRFTSPIPDDAFRVYERLRRITPSRYGSYLNVGDFQIAGASPELFLRKKGRNLMTCPIKGTRPRGRDREEDADNLAELLACEKDRAELSMIVDLERNDLGRVCEYGTVRVADHRYVDELPTVFHTVSRVEGIMREGLDAVDLLLATFPGGSITGAPKIRAMELIDELEPVRRGVYTGAVGYWDNCGDLALNIAIRTMVIRGATAGFHVGAGIVADSDPAAEFEETGDKARAMIQALKPEGAGS